jgi:hypothetical protein
MKNILKRLFTFIVICVLIAPRGGEGVAAQSPQPEDALPDAAKVFLLEDPGLSGLDVPAGLDRAQAEAFADRVARQQAETFLARYPQVRLIEGTDGLLRVSSLAQSETGMPAAADSLEMRTCAANRLAALADQVEMFSQDALRRSLMRSDRAIMTPDPLIEVNYNPTGSSGITGTTTPSTEVTMTLRRGGGIIASRTGISGSNGYYSFYPSYIYTSCNAGDYEWKLAIGDVVEVSAHGVTAQTTLVSITGMANPVTNVVSGTTVPGQALEVRVYNRDSLPSCSASLYTLNGTADANGNFGLDFTATVDFNRVALAYVYARDANGHATFRSFYAFRVYAMVAGTSFFAYIPPNTAYTAVITQVGGTTTRSGMSDVYGWLGIGTAGGAKIVAGDTLEVNWNGGTIFYTAAALEGQLDPTLDRLVGITTPGRVVTATFSKQTNYYNGPNTCSSSGSPCAGAIADGGGAYAVDAMMDVERGDYASVRVFDNEGNYQSRDYINVPRIMASLGRNKVSGYWRVTTATLNLKVWDAGHTNVLVNTTLYLNTDYTFSINLSYTLAAGQIVEVSDGTLTESMTIQNVTAVANNATGHLNGDAPQGSLLAILTNPGVVYSSACKQVAQPDAGPYDLDFTANGINGQTYVDVYSRAVDGHITYRYAHAFHIQLETNAASSSVWASGYTLHPVQNYTINLWNGGSLLSSRSGISNNSGSFGVVLSNSSIQPGYRMELVTDDLIRSVTYPDTLSIGLDAVHNRLVGIGPANSLLRATLMQPIPDGWSGRAYYANTDGTGNFFIDIPSDSYISDCIKLTAGGECAVADVVYYDSNGFGALWGTSRLTTIAADGFESDDTPATAKDYSPAQHTFHIPADVDWIKFEVPENRIGKPVILETIQLGPAANPKLALYDGYGTTLLAADDDSGPGYAARIRYVFSHSGTYYLKAESYSSSSTSRCGAYYQVTIAWLQAFIPTVRR